MKRRLFALTLLGAVTATSLVLRADVYVKSESSRVYMDNEHKATNEAWLAEGKSYLKSGTRVTIMREDLNKWWVIDLGQKTYREYPLKEAQPPAVPPQPDVATLWLDYSPEYDWTITDTGEQKEISGFACRRFEVIGDTDFADVAATYWLADAAVLPAGQAYHDSLVKQLSGDPDRAGLLKLLNQQPHTVPVLRQEVIERSIAPTIRQTATLLKIEDAAPPAGVYDLPAGLKKIAAEGD